VKQRRLFASAALVALGASFIPPADAGTGQQVNRNGAKATSSTPARSSTLALTANDRVLVVANQEADTVSFLQVSDRGQDVFKKLAEIHVGDEPRYVALSPDDREAYVTNSANGTVSVISMTTLSVVTEIAVGLEPRGVVFSPNGTRVFVANQASGTVSVIDPKQRRVIQTLGVGANPTALAITNDGDRSDTDEVVFVTRFFARRIAGGQGEVSDIGREGVVVAFLLGDPSQAKLIPLSPLADSGFTADRSLFCPQFNANLHNPIFCPDTTVASATDPKVAADPQSVFPNQLGAALIRGGILYLPNIGAQPEPPVRFNLNVQGLVHAVDVARLEQDQTRHVNINAQIKLETQPANPTQSLARLFSGDMIDIDADPQGRTFLLVSRGGDYVLKAALNSGKLNIGAPAAVKRFRTGHIPTGVVISRSGRRAYTNNSLGFSITAIDLQSDRVIARDVQSS
jgi:YVTN family beta-propeller protein